MAFSKARKLANLASTSHGIADDQVTTASIADDAVVQAGIADDAVDEARLQISNSGTNDSGETNVYMAWAESPFKYANAK